MWRPHWYSSVTPLAPRMSRASRAMSRDERRLMEDVEDQFSRVRQLCRGQKELLQGVLDFSRTRTSAKMDLAMSRLGFDRRSIEGFEGEGWRRAISAASAIGILAFGIAGLAAG